MQYFAFRWLSLLLSQVSKNIHQLFCCDYNELNFLGVSSAWCAQPLGRSPDWPDQVECTQLFVLSNFLICPKTRQFLTRSDLLIQTCAAMVFLVIWLYLSFSFKINSHHEIGAGQHQHKRLCFQHEDVTGVLFNHSSETDENAALCKSNTAEYGSKILVNKISALIKHS